MEFTPIEVLRIIPVEVSFSGCGWGFCENYFPDIIQHIFNTVIPAHS
jgi:hypothetical protein